MRFRARTLRLTALAGIAALALLGLAPDPDPEQPASPAILGVTIAPDHLRAGQAFEITIRTTPDVLALQALVMKYKLPVPRTGDGVFSASARVPWWARLYHGTFHVTFVGEAATGDQAQMEADVRI
ncbi:MAG TPA: hypothetical protein VGP41_08875 [Candidatus Lustribacter sp.]|jgi:hypothetical protein|nr:hypothetical protein [Candidatus Lustribacter sp.]